MAPHKLGILGGSAFLDGVGLADARPRVVRTSHGAVTVHDAPGIVAIRRHGEDSYRPPHRVPHHAHVMALRECGITHAAGFASTGSLRVDLAPGAVLVPEDYMALHPPPTFADDEYLHIVPRLDPHVQSLLRDAALEAGAGSVHGGVYVQTHGPRFETAAEVRMLGAHADVVGMTAASEATLCQERGIAYAMLCIVDNYANGIGADALTLEGYRDQLSRNTALAHNIAAALIRRWKEEHP